MRSATAASRQRPPLKGRPSTRRRSGAQGGDGLAVTVGGQVEAVVEQDDAVAEPAPPLLGVVTDHVRGPAALVLCARAVRRVCTHRCVPPSRAVLLSQSERPSTPGSPHQGVSTVISRKFFFFANGAGGS